MRCLYAKRLEVTTVPDAPHAMLELSRTDYMSLIIHEPGGLLDAESLAGAVTRFHPSLKLWRYSRGASPELGRYDVTEAPVVGREPARAAPARPEPVVEATEPPPLVLQRPPESSTARSEPYASQLDHGPIVNITDEELAMLLGGLDVGDGSES